MRFHRFSSVFRYTLGAGRCVFALAVCLLIPLNAAGQVNPVPFVNQPLVPAAIAPGGPRFTLTVNGAGFVPESAVNWNGSPRPTTFVSSAQVTAAIPDTDIANPGTASVTVVSPGPGGGASNAVFLGVSEPGPPADLSRQDLPTGVGPRCVVAADFSGDGKLDVAVVNGYPVPVVSNTVSVFLGNGDGTFQSPAEYSVGYFPLWAIAADFNGDGHLDLAVANNDNNNPSVYPNGRSVAILLGNGDGTFQPLVDYPANPDPWFLAAGDFNADGKLDMAVTNFAVSTVSILLGNGDGTFQPPVAYATGPYASSRASSVAVGDFNGDGKLDLAVSNWSDDTISIFPGNGDGTFGARVDYATGHVPQTVSAADLNGDGKLDLAGSTCAATGCSNNLVSVLLGNGDGTFRAHVDYFAGAGGGSSAVVADFNGDGTLDLEVSNGYSGNTVSVLLGNGDGTFQAPITYPTGTDPLALATGDFDGDGRPDLAVANYIDETVSIMLQPPLVQLLPQSVTFTAQSVGTTSPPQTVTLTNNRAVTLNISTITVTGTNGGDFAETNTCSTSLGAGASCTMSVTFAPTATGQRAAVLTVTDDAPGSLHSVSLTGIAINPTATLSATSLDFGNQTLNTTSAPQVVTLTNSGVGPLTITSIAASADFAQSNNCGATVAEGGQCSITVTFTPTVGGARTGAITITDNAADSPQTISLTGTGVPATLTLSTTSLTFGEQNVGTTSAPQTVTVTNSGTGPLVIFSIGASGDFPQTHNCPISPATIGPSATCTISVTFRPTGGGARSGSLIIADNASGSPHSVSLTGTGIPPTIDISPASLEFGDQRVGTTSPPETITVTNTGGGPATIFSISTSAEFARTGNCPLSPATLAAAASCSINVTFRPSARGTRTGSLTLTDNATGSPHTVSLTGNGLAPDVGLSPAALNFPDQAVGVTSPPQDVTLSNTGNTVLNITGFLVTNPFAYVSGCGATVAVGASCAITVTFTPNVAGTTYGALIISDDAPGSPQTVSLTGTTAVNFGQQPVGQTSASQMVSLANASSTPRVITGVTTTGDFAQSSACGTLAAGQSCPVNLTFTPAAPGTRTGALLIADNAPGSPHLMNLTGTGMGPGVRLSAASLNFGSQFVGTTSAAQTVTLENTGNEALSLTGISLGGAASGDFAQTNNCGASLAATASCTLSVTFTPTAAGSRTGALTITDNVPSSPHTVTLTGTGSDFSLSSEPISRTVTAGQSATYTLSVGPVSGFNQAVALSCTKPAALTLATCSVSPSAATPDGTNAATVTVTVTTTARGMAPPFGGHRPPLEDPPLGRHPSLPLQMWLLALLAITVVAAAFRPPQANVRLKPDATVALAGALLLVLLWAACGGGGGAPPAPHPGTPAGTYTLTVTGTVTTGSGNLSHGLTLTLKVN